MFEKQENSMMVLVKWIAAVLLAGLAWLIGKYTVEYYRPFKK